MAAIRLATRSSPLALRQARIAADAIAKADPGRRVELVPMTSDGDRIEGDLAAAGGKDLFASSLRRAILAGEADAACHSLKDLGRQPGDLVLAAFLPREDPRDCLVGRNRAELSRMAQPRIASSSPRRAAQLGAAFPDARIVPMRGNVGTRLAKLEARECDALVLACAGLERLGKADLISERLPVDEFPPAPGQGIIALECAKGDSDLIGFLAAVDDRRARTEALAERACAEELDGDCHTPLGAHATACGAEVKLLCKLTHRHDAASATASSEDPVQAGIAAARNMLSAGGKEILDLIRA